MYAPGNWCGVGSTVDDLNLNALCMDCMEVSIDMGMLKLPYLALLQRCHITSEAVCTLHKENESII